MHPLRGTPVTQTSHPSCPKAGNTGSAVTGKAITADYLMLHGQQTAGNDTRTHLVHATCQRQRFTRQLIAALDAPILLYALGRAQRSRPADQRPPRPLLARPSQPRLPPVTGSQRAGVPRGTRDACCQR